MHWLRKNERLDDLDRELRADLELEIEEQMANGLPPQEARFAARRALGNMPLIKEQTREAWGGLWLEMLLKDIHYAVRGLFKSSALYDCLRAITSSRRRRDYRYFWHL